MSESRPQPSIQFPISEGIIGLDGMSNIRNTSEVYFPYLYSKFDCNVHNINYIFENMRNSTIEVEFTLKGDGSNIYYDEMWKLMATENFIKTYEGNIPEKPFPIFALMLNRTMYVKSTKLFIDDSEDVIMFDQSVDVMMLPDSHPPVCQLTESHYSYYEKKSTVFYGNLYFNKKYKLIINVYHGLMEFAPLFPYGQVKYEDINYKSNNSGINIDVNFQKISPQRNNVLPKNIKEVLLRANSDNLSMPRMIPASKYRGETYLFVPNGEYGLPNLTIRNEENAKKLFDITLNKENIKNTNFDNFGTFRFIFGLKIIESNKLDIIVNTTKSPLPTRIYEQIQKLPEYSDILVDYEIINFSKNNKRLKIVTEILGYSDQAKKIYALHGVNNKNGHKAVLKINQTPRFKKGILENIVTTERATLSAKVYDEDSKELIYDENHDIELLPHDLMLWRIGSAEGSISHDLSELICAWISSTDKDGLLDEVRAGCIKYHPKNSIYIKSYQVEEIDLVVKAIYQYLNNDVGIHYVNQPFSSNDIVNSQRVLTPNSVLKNKVGNCIDLTITFASILEGLGVSSLIFITPDHAFIGWGNKNKPSKMLFLETTILGSSTYEYAKQVGKNNFEENFLLQGSYSLLPNSLLKEIKGCQIIDLNEIRRKGIHSLH